MKIDEFKAIPKKKMNEVSAGWSALKGMFGGNGSQQQLTQDVFIDDFVKDALISIKNGISGGNIDPSAKSAEPPPKTPPSGPTPPPGEITKGGAITRPTKTSSNPIAGSGANYTTGASPETNLKVNAKKDGKPVKESRYDRLNAIFESIVLGEEDPAPPPTKDRSLQKYLTTWYNSWMRNINWHDDEDHINSLIKKVADSYSKDGGRAALTQLAQASFSIAQANKGVPFGAENAVAKAGGGGAGSEKRTPDQIKALIADLHKKDPSATTELITDLIKTYVKGSSK